MSLNNYQHHHHLKSEAIYLLTYLPRNLQPRNKMSGCPLPILQKDNLDSNNSHVVSNPEEYYNSDSNSILLIPSLDKA
ncbi:hypothetical protein QQP08_009967 [Theobroma cacao]|nr:hypothetical protein QQP08_009967 [Theobroma cacao]